MNQQKLKSYINDKATLIPLPGDGFIQLKEFISAETVLSTEATNTNSNKQELYSQIPTIQSNSR